MEKKLSNLCLIYYIIYTDYLTMRDCSEFSTAAPCSPFANVYEGVDTVKMDHFFLLQDVGFREQGVHLFRIEGQAVQPVSILQLDAAC